MSRFLFLLGVLLELLILTPFSLSRVAPADSFELQVIHLNDFHARYVETNDQGGECKDDTCIGGFSRMYAAVNTILKYHGDAIILNGGDNFQGTLFYNLFKWNVTQYFLNKVPWDAIVLGNHEFDDGIEGLVPFIKALNAPVIVSNINDTLEPDLQGIYRKSVVVERNGKKIGIIGVIIQSLHELSNIGDLSLFDESESVNKEAERLVAEEGVFTNIVLSHSGYDIEKNIAKKATAKSKIGLVVGGHSHTFLFTGDNPPGPGDPAGPYPTVITRDEDSKQVLVVQASAYCRYLGNLSVTYDSNGDYLEHEGAPIFLSHTLPQDEGMNQELIPWKEGVDAKGKAVIGSSLVMLDQTTCRTSECTLGNFVADAMVFSYTSQADLSQAWTYAALAVYNTGGLRTSIYNGNITYADMATAQPFENTFDVGEIQGKYIKQLFEQMMTPHLFTRVEVDVNMLQTSGFRIVANISNPIGSRIESIKVRCSECLIPIYENLDMEKTYKLIVPSFLKTGGDGFTSIADHLKNIKVGRVDIDVFVDYLGKKSPIFQEIEGRLVIKGGEQVKMLYRR